MATVSVRVPDALKQRMEALDTVDWSAIIRENIREELSEREERTLAHAVAASERLSAGIDPSAVEKLNTAERIRRRRDRRSGCE